MTRVLVEKDGEVLFDRNFEDEKVFMSSRRMVSGVKDKNGNHSMAPSRIVQEVIICEQYVEKINAEITTMDTNPLINALKK